AQLAQPVVRHAEIGFRPCGALSHKRGAALLPSMIPSRFDSLSPYLRINLDVADPVRDGRSAHSQLDLDLLDRPALGSQVAREVLLSCLAAVTHGHDCVHLL